MERSYPWNLSGHEEWPLVSIRQKASKFLQLWRSNRRAAKVLRELSTEQLRDCGIQAPELNVPSLEVPAGLIQELMSMR
jgi:uncharacterized protein YjiS (DUF1127 family)